MNLQEQIDEILKKAIHFETQADKFTGLSRHQAKTQLLQLIEEVCAEVIGENEREATYAGYTIDGKPERNELRAEQHQRLDELHGVEATNQMDETAFYEDKVDDRVIQAYVSC